MYYAKLRLIDNNLVETLPKKYIKINFRFSIHTKYNEIVTKSQQLHDEKSTKFVVSGEMKREEFCCIKMKK